MLSFTEQIVGGSYTPMPDGNLTTTFNFSDGTSARMTGALNGGATGLVSALDGVPSMGTSNAFAVYLVDANRSVVIETDGTQLGLGLLSAAP